MRRSENIRSLHIAASALRLDDDEWAVTYAVQMKSYELVGLSSVRVDFDKRAFRRSLEGQREPIRRYLDRLDADSASPNLSASSEGSEVRGTHFSANVLRSPLTSASRAGETHANSLLFKDEGSTATSIGRPRVRRVGTTIEVMFLQRKPVARERLEREGTTLDRTG